MCQCVGGNMNKKLKLKMYSYVILFVSGACFLVSRFQDVIKSHIFSNNSYWVLFWIAVVIFIKMVYFYGVMKRNCQEAVEAGNQSFLHKFPNLVISLLFPIEVAIFYIFITDTVPIVSSWVSGEATEHVLVITETRRSRKHQYFCPGYFEVSGYGPSESYVCSNSKTLWSSIRSKRGSNAYCRILAVGKETLFGFVPERFELIDGPDPDKRPFNC